MAPSRTSKAAKAANNIRPHLHLSIAILIGGKSSRFGSNKLIHPIEDKPMALHVLEAARPLSDSICFVSRPSCEANEHLQKHSELIFDEEGFEGPLAGICAALHWSKKQRVLVLAGDLPLVTSEVLARLLDHKSDALAVAPMIDGILQPLCGVYHTKLASLCLRLLREGRRAAHSLFDATQGEPIHAATLGNDEAVIQMLRGVNTRSDLSQPHPQLASLALPSPFPENGEGGPRSGG